MIDICDFAVGLSRQLYGLAIASERPGHRMTETWHPLGPCAVISAFNFPVAVWSWNAALALVCGDPVIWEPSEKTPLSALATMKILDRALKRSAPTRPKASPKSSSADRRSAKPWSSPLFRPPVRPARTPCVAEEPLALGAAATPKQEPVERAPAPAQTNFTSVPVPLSGARLKLEFE